jgi:hypothetical protein
MNGSFDQVGDILRAFYRRFGMPDEGPPASQNVTAQVGEDVVPRADLDVLQEAVNDMRLQRQFDECRRIVDELATRLTTEEFLQELSVLPSVSADRFEQLSNGVFWFSLAASLDTRDADGLPTLPDALQSLDLPFPMKVRLTVAGSLVLRLYVALVYMREGTLTELIDDGALLRKPCCTRVKKLLNCDFLRRIRNALSHGSFSESIAGIVFKDGDGQIPATPGFLNWLCTWINLVQLSALAATSRENSGLVH